MYLHIYIIHTHTHIHKFEYEGNMINAYVCQKSYVNLSIQSIFPALLDKRN